MPHLSRRGFSRCSLTGLSFELLRSGDFENFLRGKPDPNLLYKRIFWRFSIETNVVRFVRYFPAFYSLLFLHLRWKSDKTRWFEHQHTYSWRENSLEKSYPNSFYTQKFLRLSILTLGLDFHNSCLFDTKTRSAAQIAEFNIFRIRRLDWYHEHSRFLTLERFFTEKILPWACSGQNAKSKISRFTPGRNVYKCRLKSKLSFGWRALGAGPTLAPRTIWLFHISFNVNDSLDNFFCYRGTQLRVVNIYLILPPQELTLQKNVGWKSCGRVAEGGNVRFRMLKNSILKAGASSWFVSIFLPGGTFTSAAWSQNWVLDGARLGQGLH